MKKISIVSSCYNEAENVSELCKRVRVQMELFPQYEYEHILLDNGSTDTTAFELKRLAFEDSRIKVILNSRNFGHIRSPFYGMLQASGDVICLMASDLQDPPELIPEFISLWEQGHKMVLGVKEGSEESFLMYTIRCVFYTIISKIADDETFLVKNHTGFGFYDRQVIDVIRELNDPYPYFRGLICDLGFEKAIVKFHQPLRKRGLSSYNFYMLYDNAMLGITKHSRVPLRLLVFLGFFFSLVSGSISLFYLVAKLLFWDRFSFGLSPILVGIFFFFSIQLFFMGVLGEYVGAILVRVNTKPLVVEKERLNF